MTLISTFASFYDSAFVKCKGLESLSISTIDDIRPKVVSALKNSLKSNHGLKKLKLQCKPIFHEDFSSEINFKLKEFEVQSLDLHQYVRTNLNLFLMTQWDSLETLSIDRWIDDNVMGTILSMPHLKNLSLGLRDLGSVRTLPQSDSITTLNLSYMWGCPIRKFILEAFPNVENLTIADMSGESADIISETCINLKRLSIKYFMANRISNEEFFMKLESFTCDGIQPVNHNGQKLFKKLKVKLKKTQID